MKLHETQPAAKSQSSVGAVLVPASTSHTMPGIASRLRSKRPRTELSSSGDGKKGDRRKLIKIDNNPIVMAPKPETPQSNVEEVVKEIKDEEMDVDIDTSAPLEDLIFEPEPGTDGCEDDSENEFGGDDGQGDGEEDSNDESNWRNQYPDESDLEYDNDNSNYSDGGSE